jgi:hypothetical protein
VKIIVVIVKCAWHVIAAGIEFYAICGYIWIFASLALTVK